MRIKQVMRYNLFHIPGDIVEIVGTHNFFALWLALMYYGGGVIIIHRTISLGLPWCPLIWLIAMLVNIHLSTEFPGLFYLDDVTSTDFLISIAILGPINFLRALCLGITFVHKIKNPYPFTIRHFFRTPPETWSLNDPWIKAIQRSRDIEMRTLAGDIRWALFTVGKQLWKVGNTRITTLMVLKTLLFLVVLFVLLVAIHTVRLKILGRM